uniref:Interleukin n=2 Tax=Cyprinus carpio TaxID=7962 RepID=A0A8C1ZGY0_CYPCA
MFALHRICALTLALVICLNAQPVKRDADELLEHISFLKTFIGTAKCPDHIHLHSPFNIKKDCMSSARDCTIKMLYDLKSKCNITKNSTTDEAINNVILELGTEETNPTSSSPDCKCEMYNKTGVDQFLKNMEVQAEQLNSMQ